MQKAIPRKRPFTDNLQYRTLETVVSPQSTDPLPIHFSEATSADLDQDPPSEGKSQIEPESGSTPRRPDPDVFFGLADEAITKGLVLRGFPPTESSRYLRTLQHKKGVLSSEPTQRSCGLRFPFFVFEGKSAATSGNIYKAENQAAGAGACALKILADLDTLALPAMQGTIPSTSSSQPSTFVGPSRALFFSLTTQGPLMELWVHYKQPQNALGNFHSYCFFDGRNTHWDRTQEFVRRLKAIVDWACTAYIESVLEKLSSCATNGVGLR
ncbi:hypothetical protein BDY21DRAFT_281486 [Lineolata rhizophorae]|uniref:DUF7924 domain-containing protein n=1 Tax=Lineolata rhizophorae TaxID=578093 RepID=A0A6A6P7H8_9PEZI|nr:hypothetical protein BDY21DRAFT_281486 [Lineolata rhizophorae]